MTPILRYTIFNSQMVKSADEKSRLLFQEMHKFFRTMETLIKKLKIISSKYGWYVYFESRFDPCKRV